MTELVSVNDYGDVQHALGNRVEELTTWSCGVCGRPAVFALDLDPVSELRISTSGGGR
jgi:hypothetical protein